MGLKICLVTETEKQRWILRYWAEELQKRIDGSAVATKADSGADVNVFINYALYQDVPTKTIGVFTHREFKGPLKARFDKVARRVDWCVAQCEITASHLPKARTSVLRFYPIEQFYKDNLVLGVVGRSYKSGRKRLHWLGRLEQIPGIKIKRPRKKLPEAEMPAFYDGLDYLVVLSENEGGPMPVLEAMARGKPVIAPNVGWCWEFPGLCYRDLDELVKIVEGLVIPRNGWDKTAAALEGICTNLISTER